MGSRPHLALDLGCAAGRTTRLLADVTRATLVVGIDISEAFLSSAPRAPGIAYVRADATRLPPELRDFDRALVDVPCSGLGVLARRPDLRWRAQPLPDLQLALLRAAAERVRPGGTVVYAVCTLNADENEAVVDASGLVVDSTLADEWPRFRHPTRPEFLLTLPHVHGTSGFFIGRLKA